MANNAPIRPSKFDVYELISEIRPRPALYLGAHSIVRLRSFLDGCFYMAHNFGIEVVEHPYFGEFHYWVSERYLGAKTTAGWCDIILQQCNGDESKALDVFFELLDEFRQSEYKSGLYSAP